MKIATYKDFERIEKSKKTIEKLKNSDFSQVKKLSNLPYFRIKVNYEDRIIFTFFRFENENYILLLEYIKNHEYVKSQFLRGKKWAEEDFEFSKEEIEEVIFLNKKKEFSYFDKFISFSETQENILNLNLPIILIGSAGSGKTSVLIEKLQTFNGKVIYISLSKNLVENSKEICSCSKNIDFLTFGELFKIENEITFEKFKGFSRKNSIKDVEKYFEEFRGVITGNFEKPYLLENEYLDLGIKNSLFNKEDKSEVYFKFKKYLEFLKSENLTDSNIESLELLKTYDFIVIDEVQDFTNSQISTILKNGKNFILSGDSNQIIYSNFFSWTKLKTMLFKTDENSQISILSENYRNSKSITEISNKLLKIKQLRFGSIDKESNYLIETISKKDGEIFFWSNGAMEEELNEKKKDDVTFAVIVFDEKAKQEAIDTFQTPLVFTVKEAKGLEYKNVILFNFISNESKKFFDIISNIEKLDLEKELKYSRPKDKTDRELDIYKIYINSLYVAFTRGIENLYIIEKKEHKIWELLGIAESKKVIFEKTLSKNEAWGKEAKRLEKFGRTEQVKGINKKLELKTFTQEKNIKPKKMIISKQKPIKVKLGLSDYKKLVFENNQATKGNKDKLFKLAKAENDLDLIKDMDEKLNFKSAKIYLKNLGENSLNRAIENIDLSLLKNSIKSGGSVKGLNISTLLRSKANIEFLEVLLENGANANSRDEHGNSILLLATQHGHKEIVELLIQNGSDINLIDINNGFSALMIASQLGYIEIAKLLIENNTTNLDLQGENGATALILASEYGHKEIVKTLIDNNANINLQAKNGATGLTLASGNKHIEIAKLLIENDANINSQNIYGRSALVWASEDGYIEMAKLLVENGANIDLPNKDGITALIMASENKHIEIVKLLIDNDANINMEAKDGFTALKLASQYGYTEIVRLLLEHGANIDIQNKLGVNSLMTASQKGYIEIVKVLIENGANLDLENNIGLTALMTASQTGHTEIVKLLIDNGANF